MPKTLLITGATDGIGFETAKILVKKGHIVLLHGRNLEKLQAVASELSAFRSESDLGSVDHYTADLSDLAAVKSMADSIAEKYSSLDVLINNAGVEAGAASNHASGPAA